MSLDKSKSCDDLDVDKIPVFIRSSHEYERLAEKNGFTTRMEAEPPFTKEFLARYPTCLPINNSEYILMGFKKAS